MNTYMLVVSPLVLPIMGFLTQLVLLFIPCLFVEIASKSSAEVIGKRSENVMFFPWYFVKRMRSDVMKFILMYVWFYALGVAGLSSGLMDLIADA